MFIFWKGKTMVDYRDDNAKYGNEETNRENGYGENKYGENGHNGCGSNCGCECCQCKRNFMMCRQKSIARPIPTARRATPTQGLAAHPTPGRRRAARTTATTRWLTTIKRTANKPVFLYKRVIALVGSHAFVVPHCNL